MPYREGDETVSFEAKVEHTTAKARLVEPTMVGPKQAWLPKSQTISMEDLGDDLFMFVVTKWWADKNGIEE